MAAEYSFSFTDAAAADLDEILGYISEELRNPSAAKSFLDKTQAAVSKIRSFPLSGVRVENPYVKRKDIRRVNVGNHVLYYLPDQMKREIIILRIVYGRRDRERLEERL